MKTLCRTLWIIGVFCMVAACAPAPAPTPTPAPPTEVPTLVPSPTPAVPRTIAFSPRDQVTLRFLHAAAGVGDVDVYAADLAVATRLKFGDGVDGARIAAGEYMITAYPAGAGNSGVTLYQSPEPVTLEGGTRYNVLLTVVEGVLRLTAIPDDNTPLADGEARLLFINAAPSINAVQLGVQGSTPLVTNLDFGLSSPPLTIATERLTVQARSEGQVLSEYVLSPRQTQHYTLVLMPNANGSGVRLVEFTSTIPGLAQVRVVNGMGTEAGPIDIFVDDAKIASSIVYGSTSDLITVTAQPATVRIVSTGDEALLLATSISPNSNDQILLQLTGDETSIALTSYVDNVDMLSSNDASITFLNLYAASPTLRAIPSDGVIQDTIEINYSSRPITLTIDAGENSFNWGTPDELDQTEFNDRRTFQAGFHYLYILTGREDAPVLVFERPVAVAETAVVTEVAQVRWINAIEGANATFALGETAQANNIPYIGSSPFTHVQEGEYTLIVNTGAGSANLPFNPQAFAQYSVYAYGTPETPALAIVRNDDIIVESGNGRVRLVQIAPDGSAPMSLAFVENPTAPINSTLLATPSSGEAFTLPGGLRPIVGGTIPAEHSIAARIEAGIYDFYIIDDSANGVINTLNGIQVRDGEALEIVAVRSTTSSGISVFAMPYSTD